MKQGSILLLARCNSNNSAPSIRYRCSILNVVAKRNITTGLFGLGLDEEIKVITKLPNSEQSYKGKVKTHNYINRQNQSTIL